MAVADLESAAAKLRLEPGLEALPGGRHPGAGTANLIVPLGSSYLELIAIVEPEEAAANPLSRRVSNALARGATFATWAVRCDDIDAVRARLAASGIETTGPRDGSRRRPDGVTIRWRTLHIADGLEPAIPFFIEWEPGGEAHPGDQPVRHPGGAAELKRLRLTSPEPRVLEATLRALTGAPMPLEIVTGARAEISALVLVVGDEERALS